MVLADTSVWVAHFGEALTELAELLLEVSVLMHPFVIGELACGNLKNRAGILADLNALPLARTAADDEVLRLIGDRRLWGQGLGWVDAHLLASALLTNCRLWTLDKRLDQAARRAGCRR